MPLRARNSNSNYIKLTSTNKNDFSADRSTWMHVQAASVTSMYPSAPCGTRRLVHLHHYLGWCNRTNTHTDPGAVVFHAYGSPSTTALTSNCFRNQQLRCRLSDDVVRIMTRRIIQIILNVLRYMRTVAVAHAHANRSCTALSHSAGYYPPRPSKSYVIH